MRLSVSCISVADSRTASAVKIFEKRQEKKPLYTNGSVK